MKTKVSLILFLILLLASCQNELPRILIIGDSISIGYTPFVTEMLEGKALVMHNEGNAQHTGTGLEKISEWIGDGNWDIVQFNWGLWDLAYRNPEVNNVGNRDKINGVVTYSPEEYGKNLDSLVTTIKSLTKAKLLFVTTSYVPEGEAGRFVKDSPIYNKAAVSVMQKHQVPVNDLYDYSKEIHSVYGAAPDNVHYSRLGSRQLAKKVIEGLAKINRKIKDPWSINHIKVSAQGVGGGLKIEDVIEEAHIIRKQNPGRSIFIELQAGDHFLKESMVLDESLSDVIISGPDNKEAWIKGALRKKIVWEKMGTALRTRLPDLDKIEQLVVDGAPQILARYPNFNEQGGHWQGHAADAIAPERVKTWKDPVGGYVHAMHSGEWGGFHYRISGVDLTGKVELVGGQQNNRPSSMHNTYRMVENILEEMDEPGEFFFDRSSKYLYWIPRDTGMTKESLIEIPILDQLVVLSGSIDHPVKKVTIKNLGFQQSKRTFMQEYEPLLRSDWTIYRGAAIMIQGAEDCRLSSCTLTLLGGNGIFLSGYNREVEITGNHIHDIGASGISVVGLPDAVRSPSFQYSEFIPLGEMDTIRGPKTEDYSANVLIANNLIYRTGRIEKQTAGVQLSMCMDITVSHNSIYDVPRAGINIGDGTWGGHTIEFNDIFMTVQESGDHGSFNSWGRDRYWHPNRGVMDSLTSADPAMPLWDAIHTTVIRNNRFRCDHGWDIDLDDGSSNYHIYNNLCLNGGIKLREGFYRIVENNIMVNNGFHPHVWFANSEDIFRHNIVMTAHKDIRLEAWGKEVDFNIFPNEQALEKARQNGTDKNSIYGNPDFVAPEQGNYRVTENSPAFKIGFKNFDMDQFGVQMPELKQLAKEPEIPESLNP